MLADCHLIIEPVCPDKFKVVEFVPVHTDVAPAILPPTEAGFTSTKAELENAVSHAPDFNTAR